MDKLYSKEGQVELLSDLRCDLRLSPGKATVVADALEQERRTRTTLSSSLREQKLEHRRMETLWSMADVGYLVMEFTDYEDRGPLDKLAKNVPEGGGSRDMEIPVQSFYDRDPEIRI
ncbi:hypothetical protein Tco_1220834 [Tanacetum coccineum]